MLISIDHLVIAVADPEAAAADLADALGLAFTVGGRHPAAGTENRLAFFGDAYLELIAVLDASLAAANPIGAAALGVLDASGAGLASFAVSSNDIAGDVARLRAGGARITAPMAGERRRPDGETVRWLTAGAARLGPAEPPFLIEHELAGPEWGSAARRARGRFEHPAGGRVRLVGLELAVADPAAVAAAYRQQVGLAMEPAAGSGPGDWEVRVGEQAIRLVRVSTVDGSQDGATIPAPPARVGLRGSIGPRTVVDRFGVRFTRL